MFGKKKKVSATRVMHYEGIPGFSTDYPCTLELKDGQLIITRIKPETVVTLPISRISSFTAMTEPRFMEKYHGSAMTTTKMKGVQKYYLVIQYDKGMVAFWGTAKEYGFFLDLQNNGVSSPAQIEL